MGLPTVTQLQLDQDPVPRECCNGKILVLILFCWLKMKKLNKIHQKLFEMMNLRSFEQKALGILINPLGLA